jgi:HEAT repeat protein
VPDPRLTPAQQVAYAVARYGESEVVDWAAGLLTGAVLGDSADHPPLRELSGHDEYGYADERRHGYWPRVWGARVLLYIWHPVAIPAVMTGLDDQHWRVREMAAKVVRQREIGEAADAVAGLVRDEVPRVRTAAVRALAVVGEGEHADAVRAAEKDHDEPVRRAARAALVGLRRRLDRDV